MRISFPLFLLAFAAAAMPAVAQPARAPDLTPWDANGGLRQTAPLPLGYDTDGDQDKRPELRPDQQGGGQQTGGPARNLIPGDNLHVSPR